MSNGNMKKIRVDRNNSPQGETDWERVDAMSDEETRQNAMDDLDNPPAEALPEGALVKVFRPQWIRRRLGMSQREFAETFGIPVRSLQQWEQGRSEPNQAIRAYLRVIALDPEAVKRALRKTMSA